MFRGGRRTLSYSITIVMRARSPLFRQVLPPFAYRGARSLGQSIIAQKKEPKKAQERDRDIQASGKFTANLVVCGTSFGTL